MRAPHGGRGFGGGAHFSLPFHISPPHLALPTKPNGIHGHQALVLSCFRYVFAAPLAYGLRLVTVSKPSYVAIADA